MAKPTFPARGQKSPNFWDDDLKAYVDFGTSLEVVDGGTVALDDTYDEGDLAGYRVKATTTFTGEGGEIEVEPGVYVFERTADGWEAYAATAGTPLGSAAPPDDTPPVAPTSLATNPEADTILLTFENNGFAAEGRVNGGVYVDYGTDESIDLAALHPSVTFSPASEHSGHVRTKNGAGVRSAAVAWGPTSVDSMALHDLILSMEPEYYTRLTQGIEDFSRVPATWVPYNQYGGPGVLPTDFTGPPLTPGDAGSQVPQANTRVERPSNDLLVGATELTLFTVGGYTPDGSAGGGGGSFYYGDTFFGGHILPGGAFGPESYSVHKPGGVHSWFTIWNPALHGNNGSKRYQNGNSNWHSEVGGPGAAPLVANSGGYLSMGGNPYGGSAMGGYCPYIVIFKRQLTLEERVALATSAGTINNAADEGWPT